MKEMEAKAREAKKIIKDEERKREVLQRFPLPSRMANLMGQRDIQR